MTIPPNLGLVAALRAFSRAAGLAAILIGILVLLGWFFGIEPLKRIVPGLVAMNPATAVAFVLAGASLRMLGSAAAGTQQTARALAVAVALIGLIKLAGILFGWDAGIDRMLFPSRLEAAAVGGNPNRMAPTTATSFLLLGLALLLAGWQTRRGYRPAQIPALIVTGIAALALIGYLYRVQSFTGVPKYIQMALPTALTFLALSIGLLCARPDRGLMISITSEGPGGAMLRRALIVIVLLPLGMGGVILGAQRVRSGQETLAFALFVVLIIAVFSIMAWTNAVSLDRAEARRRAADEALRAAHDALDQRVRERTGDLDRVLGEIREGIDVLGVSASEISASTSHLAAGATDTAAAVGETTTTVEEVRQTAHLASDKAGDVAQSAQNAVLIARDGTRAAEGMAQDMERIRQQMDAIAEGMARLSEQSQAIGEITATVNELAQQSNLLAVNASIEAAQAGEQGKGFAVVAQEVKNLADQSRQATRQIRSLLGDIQKATNAAVLATEQGGKAVEAGVEQSAQAGESIQSLAERVSEAAQAATQIAASSQQQMVGMDQVAIAMRHVHQASAQNVDSARQLEISARSLADLGHRLKELVERYNLS